MAGVETICELRTLTVINSWRLWHRLVAIEAGGFGVDDACWFAER